MVRRFLPRLPLFRTFSRVSVPILPVTRPLRSPSPPVSLTSRTPNSPFFRNFPARLASDSPSSSQSSSSPPNATLSQRLKHLIKSYGWYALGVYLFLGVVDFGVAFAGINLLGAEQVSKVAASVKESVASFVHSKPPEPGRDELESTAGNGTGQEGLYAMLVLAYTIHKTLFVPVRVGLTAAFTPKLVHWLRARGWAGGEGTRRAAQEMKERFRGNRNQG